MHEIFMVRNQSGLRSIPEERPRGQLSRRKKEKGQCAMWAGGRGTFARMSEERNEPFARMVVLSGLGSLPQVAAVL